MKIILTESQLKRVRLITESQELANKFLRKADDIKEKVNRIYSKLIFSTLSEMIDGDIDLSDTLKSLMPLSEILRTHYNNAMFYFDNLPKNELDNEMGTLQSKVEETFKNVLDVKIYGLENLISGLDSSIRNGVANDFKDVRKINL